MLADPAMQPPVALLCYPEDDPAATSFWPFAEFSPEYQAALWAVRNGAALRFIDLPSCARLSQRSRRTSPSRARRAAAIGEAPETPRPLPPHVARPDRHAGARRRLRGRRELVVRRDRAEPGAGTDLRRRRRRDDGAARRRDRVSRPSRPSARRICGSRSPPRAKEFDGPIAVVCGAWHVPALKVARCRGRTTRRC